jgi:hypothetical protein
VALERNLTPAQAQEHDGAADRVRIRCLLLLYALLVAGVACTLGSFTIPLHHDQLLPVSALREQPLRSLWHLHAQPPLFNAGLSLALWLEDHAGVVPEVTLACLQLGFLFGTQHALLCLALALIPAPRLRRVVYALLLLNPALVLAAAEWTYTLHEAFYLARAALHVQRWSAARRGRHLIACGGWLLALTLTRALFHPAFAILALVVVLCCAPPRTARPHLVAAGTTATFALAALAWPLKNYALFGFCGNSSWLGYNLSRDLGVALPPEWSLFDCKPTAAADRVRRVANDWVPARFAGVSALTLVEKPGRAPNWNHYWMLHAAADLLAASLRCIAHDPAAFLARAHHNYLRCYAFSTLRHPYTGHLPAAAAPGSWLRPWLLTYETLSCGWVFADDNRRPTPALAFVLPLTLGFVVVQLTRKRSAHVAATRPAVLFLLLSALWVLALVIFVDGAEGNRMRISTEPLWWLAAVWATAIVTQRNRAG